jgi:hypothetical protein
VTGDGGLWDAEVSGSATMKVAAGFILQVAPLVLSLVLGLALTVALIRRTTIV